MSFLYPLGFLGLLGIPILIIIYIIKNKYTEQVIPATYLWTLSEKFLKRRNPISKLTGIISLILQILAVILISVAISHPVFTFPGAANDYCFILDASGSMNFDQGGKTRLDIGKEKISDLVKKSANGSAYTIVCVGNDTKIVCEGLEDKDRTLELLSEISPAYTAQSFANALTVAQGYFRENSSVLTYLITDKSYETSENVEIVTVSAGEENYAVTELASELTENSLVVNGKVVSYESDATLTLRLYLDGKEELIAEQSVHTDKLALTPFEFRVSRSKFQSVKVAIAEKDALSEDNECVYFDVNRENACNTLLVSDSPYFFATVFDVLGNVNLQTVSTKDYAEQSGFDLYVFDNFTPDRLPKSGASWFINPSKNLENAGFSVQGEIELENAEELKKAKPVSSALKTLLQNVPETPISVKSYVKCGLLSRYYVLMTCEGSPVLFTGTDENGNRETVFAFDLHKTNLSVLSSFVVLARNLLDDTFPKVMSGVSFYCGDTLTINAPASCEEIRVDTPLGNVDYPVAGASSAEYQLNERGVYTITLKSGETAREYYVYAAFPEEERIPSVREQSFRIEGEAGTQKRDGKFDSLLIWFILLAVVVAADWGVYCYEQYQLR